MRLYEIGQDILSLVDQLEDMDASPEVIADTIEANFGEDFEEKATATAAAIKNLQAEADMFEAEAKKLKERSQALKNRADNLKDYLDTWMKLTGKTQIKRGVHELKYRAGVETVEVDLEQLPRQYFVPMEPKPLTKPELKKMVKEGHTIPGVKLVRTNPSLQIK